MSREGYENTTRLEAFSSTSTRSVVMAESGDSEEVSSSQGDPGEGSNSILTITLSDSSESSLSRQRVSEEDTHVSGGTIPIVDSDEESLSSQQISDEYGNLKVGTTFRGCLSASELQEGASDNTYSGSSAAAELRDSSYPLPQTHQAAGENLYTSGINVGFAGYTQDPEEIYEGGSSSVAVPRESNYPLLSTQQVAGENLSTPDANVPDRRWEEVEVLRDTRYYSVVVRRPRYPLLGTQRVAGDNLYATGASVWSADNSNASEASTSATTSTQTSTPSLFAQQNEGNRRKISPSKRYLPPQHVSRPKKQHISADLVQESSDTNEGVIPEVQSLQPSLESVIGAAPFPDYLGMPSSYSQSNLESHVPSRHPLVLAYFTSLRKTWAEQYQNWKLGFLSFIPSIGPSVSEDRGQRTIEEVQEGVDSFLREARRLFPPTIDARLSAISGEDLIGVFQTSVCQCRQALQEDSEKDLGNLRTEFIEGFSSFLLNLELGFDSARQSIASPDPVPNLTNIARDMSIGFWNVVESYINYRDFFVKNSDSALAQNLKSSRYRYHHYLLNIIIAIARYISSFPRF